MSRSPLVTGLSLLLLFGVGAPRALAAPQSGADSSLSEVAEAQKDEGRSALEEAVTLLESGAHAEASARLAPLVERGGEVGLAARYHFAKSLYRMGFLHAGLAELEPILAEGPKSPYFGAALEWSLFIGRKMVDDVAVNEVLVRHTDGKFPEKYRDEFLFRLGRHHYTRALVEEALAGTPSSAPSEAPPEEDGISFDEDLFSEEPPAKPEPERRATNRPGRAGRRGRGRAQKERASEEGGRISFGADLFSEEAPEKEAPSTRAPAQEPGSMSPEAHREAARRLVARVSPGSRFFAQARFLEGALLVEDKRENDALGAFKEVIEAAAVAPEGETEDARRRRLRLRELAFFQVARLHFGAGQPSFSIFYYKKVDRDSLQWLDALYEASWAEYRLGSYERALGNLLTVHAPFFEDIYFPESLILKAVIYYENCRYREAGEIIQDFLTRFEPLFKTLERMAGEPRTPADWYGLLERVEAPGEDPLVGRVLRIALRDPEVRRLSASIEEVSSETRELEAAARRSPIAGAPRFASLLETLNSERSRLEAAAGRAVERKLRNEAEAVRTLVAQALRVKVETAKAEEGRLEASLSRRDQRPKDVSKEFVRWTDDEKLVWPFEGEYWRDELGTYELTLARACR